MINFENMDFRQLFLESIFIGLGPAESRLVWFFFRLQTSYSNLPKQVGILSPSIQIVFQNIENSSIREHVKIGIETANYGNIYGHRLQK